MIIPSEWSVKNFGNNGQLENFRISNICYISLLYFFYLTYKAVCNQNYVQRKCIQLVKQTPPSTTIDNSTSSERKDTPVVNSNDDTVRIRKRFSVEFGETRLTTEELFCKCSKEIIKHGYRFFSINNESKLDHYYS